MVFMSTVVQPIKPVQVNTSTQPAGSVTVNTNPDRTDAVIGVVKETSTVVSQTLAYAPGAGGETSNAALRAHIDDPEPHPAYDVDIPVLKLYFENGLI